MFDHGLVAGKFWPLHRGHDYLIRSALAQSKRVTIFVVKSPNETPNADVRATWVREAYPTANVHVISNLFMDDSTHESNVYWAEYTRQILKNDAVDAVFSSEDYADGWAQELGATHVKVDSEREMFAVSGTMIRSNPMAYWHLIHRVARPYYLKRVLVVGAESVGKSTLVRNLSRHYRTLFTPEYGRIYVERHGITDMSRKLIFSQIVNNQYAIEDEMAKEADRLLFVDTDLLTTSLWYQLWETKDTDSMSQLIVEEFTRRPKYDLAIILSDEHTVWKDDGLRDQEGTRAQFTKFFKDNVTKVSNASLFLGGEQEKRQEKAIEVIDRLLLSERTYFL